jgi:hypothetical protein
MTHPLIRSEIFIETAFEKRFQAMLRSAWQKQSWHVIVADPGSGKTMGIRDLIRTAGSPAVLAVTAPKNNEDEMALGNQFFSALGLPIRGRWSDRKPKLMGAMVQFGVKCLIVDDAQDLSLEHLMFIKELTDQGRLQYNYPLGLCLVTAGRGSTIPLKEIFDRPDTMWVQFRRRLDKLDPYCRVVGHTSEEVREILATLETVYRELFPHLNLRQWTTAIYTWLTQPVLDPTSSGRVTMDYLMKLVTIALEWSYVAGETEVRAETLKNAAELLILRRDTLRLIDGAGPSVEGARSESTSDEVLVYETEERSSEKSHAPSENPSPPQIPHREIGEQASSQGDEQGNVSLAPGSSTLSAKPGKCTFSGMVVPISAQRFLESGTSVVECPNCQALRTLELRRGVLRFKSHDKRKTTTLNTELRWAKRETDWDVAGRREKQMK